MRTDPDVCLILEGTYPYVSGGVSTWTHELILSQPHLTFSLVCILAPNTVPKKKYNPPSNVVNISHIHLQELPEGVRHLPKNVSAKLFQALELPILHLQHSAKKEQLKTLLVALNGTAHSLGVHVLLNSEDAWNMVVRMYRMTMGEGSFLNFFWSWRGLLAGMYSILLAEIPDARMYHTLCTGYAGLLTARAQLEKNKPCIVTEHGIYTNERRIEITAAQWLNDHKAMNLNILRPNYERDLKDYWIDTFSGYSQLCYAGCDQIITLYEGNKEFQVADGADPGKIRIIPNGVNFERYAKVWRREKRPPTVALVGRVVPIKDIKTFIRAVRLLTKSVPDLRAWVVGPTSEDEVYFEECQELVAKYQMSETLTFTGKQVMEECIAEIDLVVLTSISEAQPLVILECGAAGIPCVATEVGACREMVYGRSDESPWLGQGGEICPLANPQAVSEAMGRLLSDAYYYQKCSAAIRRRVKAYYHEKDQASAYGQIYEQYIGG